MTLDDIKKAQERINKSISNLHDKQLHEYDKLINEFRLKAESEQNADLKRINEYGMRLFKVQRDNLADTTPPLVKWSD